MADRRADAGQLASGHRGADARPADEHAPLGFAAQDRIADLSRLVGIVDARIDGIHAQIHHLVTEAGDGLENGGRSFTPR